jgi:ABC-type antimicrobial peptide transport system permease subunit
MVLRQGVVLAVVGLVLGLAASVGAGELLRAAFPTGDDQRDSGALLIVVPIVLAVTFLAAYLPARRASRLNPVQALRHD